MALRIEHAGRALRNSMMGIHDAATAVNLEKRARIGTAAPV